MHDPTLKMMFGAKQNLLVWEGWVDKSEDGCASSSHHATGKLLRVVMDNCHRVICIQMKRWSTVSCLINRVIKEGIYFPS